MRKGDTAPNDVNWFPGGAQPIALHVASGHLFVLMHTGEFWSHKDGATEIWDLDLTSHKVVKRLPVTGEPNVINVTQEPKPKVIVVGEGEGGSGAGLPGDATVIDPATGEVKYTFKGVGSGLAQIAP